MCFNGGREDPAQMDVWKQFDENPVTHSGAHYLMAVDTLLRQQGYARVSDVARFLEVTTGSASVSLKTLKQRGLIEEDHNRFLHLSQEGAAIAHRIQVNKQMLISLLRDVLGVPEESADIDACKIEHLLSDEVRKGLRTFLAFLRSGTPEANAMSSALKRFNFECPGVDECDLCEDTCQFKCMVDGKQVSGDVISGDKSERERVN
jgi:Mn-dependent DtxR family transcriptional regulator